MSRAHRTPWVDLGLQVCFEETEMTVLLRDGKRQTRPVSTPVFRLSDGTEFTGRRASDELRARIFQAAKAKGVR